MWCDGLERGARCYCFRVRIRSRIVGGNDVRERVQAFLDREGVEDRLKALGVAPELARKRVNAMTDEEVLVVAGRIDTLPAGGALDKTDWVIILLIVLLVIIIV